MRRLTVIRATVLLVCQIWLVGTSAGQSAERALPLNRFPVSRLVQSDTAGFYRMGTGIGDDYWDGVDTVARVRRHFTVARELGVRVLRCAFSWNGIEHEQGKFNWRFWDMLVSEAERAHILLIPYVAYTPEWAARSREEFWKQPPRDPKLYASFMETIAARYKGRILSWELWNEPDITEYWTGTREEFAELVREAAVAVRRADPQAVIVLGGVSRGPSDFLRKLITDDHIARYVDVIAMHAYPESWDPERAETTFYDWVQGIQELIASDGFGVDLWLNEIGYPDYRYRANQATRYGGAVFYAYEHTAHYTAVFLFKVLVMSAAGPASLASWYRIDDFPRTEKRLGNDLVHYHLGVVDVHGRPKPEFRSFQYFNRLFREPVKAIADATVRGPQSQAIVNIFSRKDGTVIVAAWLRSSEEGEVANKSGMLEDRRRETIAVRLPCKNPADLKTFDVFGEAITNGAHIEGSEIDAVPLRGSSVFVATAQCGAEETRH